MRSPKESQRGTTGSGHLAALDGLRGIAATIVVIRHVFNAAAMPVETRIAILHSPLAVVLNGQGAVQLFFVLSGFVLAASLARGRGWVDLLQFYVKRVFRVHAPYVFGLVFAWVASRAYPVPGGGSSRRFSSDSPACISISGRCSGSCCSLETLRISSPLVGRWESR